jgi:prolyl oligopeptidase
LSACRKAAAMLLLLKNLILIRNRLYENGFYLPEAKGGASWIDENTLMVSTDFGDGMTTSGYPKKAKIWKRGTELKDAKLVFEGSETDMGIWGMSEIKEHKTYQIITQRTSFYSGFYYAIENDKLIKAELQEDAAVIGYF